MDGFFGAIRDAMPDFWGRRVIERNAGLTQLEDFDYLMKGPDDRAGALGFGLGVEPPAPLGKTVAVIAPDPAAAVLPCIASANLGYDLRMVSSVTELFSGEPPAVSLFCPRDMDEVRQAAVDIGSKQLPCPMVCILPGVATSDEVSQEGRQWFRGLSYPLDCFELAAELKSCQQDE